MSQPIELMGGRLLDAPTDKGQWAQMLESLQRTRVRSAWDIADLLVWGIDHYTDGTADQRADLVNEISEQLEVRPKTLLNYERVARRFPPSSRFDAPLELGHHDAVMGIRDDELAYQWLHEAWANGWSVAQLRMQVATGAPEPEAVLLPNPVAVERAFYRAGIRAKVGSRRCVFETPSGTLVMTSESPITWSTTEE